MNIKALAMSFLSVVMLGALPLASIAQTCGGGRVSMPTENYGFVEGDTVECPLHMSVFCLKTGTPDNPPAIKGVTTHIVDIKDGEIHIEVQR